MIDKNNLKTLVQNLKISQDRIIAEYWEMIILKEIYESWLSEYLIFKGGTALRLAYSSPRFSEDLDFSITKEIPSEKFKKFIQSFEEKYPEVKIDDLTNKLFTWFVILKIQEPSLKYNLSVKIQISLRKMNNYKSEPRLLVSETTPLEVLASVATLDQIKEDKVLAINSREKPRDYFDLWFISQKLKQPMPELRKIDKKLITLDLNKFLSLQYKTVIKHLIDQYGKPSK